MCPNADPSHLFTIRVKLPGNITLVANAWEGTTTDGMGHSRIDVEAVLFQHDPSWSKPTRMVVFPRGSTWCGLPSHVPLDGKKAKGLVLSLLAMKPGDTDEDYFASYTSAQLTFATAYGDELAMVAEERYGDVPTSG